MSSYTVYDLSESMKQVPIEPAAVEGVVAAWGGSPEGYASWNGGFLMKLKDGRWLYLSGWCDTTGWGCQDGISTAYFDAEPELEELQSMPKPDAESYSWDEPCPAWDRDPADLNRFIRGELGEFD